MIDQLVALSKEAQEEYKHFTASKVDDIIAKLCDVGYQESEKFAEIAVTETGMGVYEHKIMKNQLASKAVYDEIKHVKTIGVINRNKENGLIEVAYPYGVVFAICPTTNPTSTALHNIIIALKGGNSIILSPHPRAVQSTMKVVEVLRGVLKKNNVNENIIQCIPQPTLDITKQMMEHKDVNLIIATGGSGLVHQAYSSGTPAYGVGPGNGPAYIDKTANIADAAKKITLSKSFDNGLLCSTESSVVVHKNIYELYKRNLKDQGCYILSKEEKVQVEQVILNDQQKLNVDIIGKSATCIARMARLEIPENTVVLAAEEFKIGKTVPFAIEKLSPLLGIYKTNDLKDAMDICDNLLALGGKGHTCSIHAQDEKTIEDFSLSMPVSRVIVNSYASIGAAGATTTLVPSLTLGCGAHGSNITSDNITATHLINIKRIAKHTNNDVEIPAVTQRDNHHSYNNQSNEMLSTDFNYEEVQNIVTKVIQQMTVK